MLHDRAGAVAGQLTAEACVGNDGRRGRGGGLPCPADQPRPALVLLIRLDYVILVRRAIFGSASGAGTRSLVFRVALGRRFRPLCFHLPLDPLARFLAEQDAPFEVRKNQLRRSRLIEAFRLRS